ncbi:MAG: FAD-dependent oxidoreductase, partial [Kiloniellaceae bacterium]
MADTNFDLIVVGGGPGGYVAAIRAAQLKMKVCVVEKQHLGGICLNWGCIPTKALLRSAEIYHYMQHADAYGLSAEKVGFDAGKVVQRSRAVSKQLNSGVGHLLKKNKVTVVDGAAKLNGPGKLTVTKDGKNIGDLTAPHIILATGARPRALPGIEPDKKLIWTYFEAMVPEKMPKTLLVIGSGAIGIEFASFYHTMGVDVTVVEVMPQILPVEDEEIAKHAHKRFEKMGMKIMTEAKVTGVKKGSDTVTATIEDKAGKKSEITVDRIISAVGVQGNIEDIGLDTTKVKTDRGCIVIDAYGRTAEKGIYAIGDVAG